jgi:hypothetical protein
LITQLAAWPLTKENGARELELPPELELAALALDVDDDKAEDEDPAAEAEAAEEVPAEEVPAEEELSPTSPDSAVAPLPVQAMSALHSSAA